MKRMLKLLPALFVLSLVTLGACGRSGNDTNKSNEFSAHDEQREFEPGDEGIYQAVLTPVNSSVAGTVSGSVEVRVEANEVIVQSVVSGAPAGVKHLQNIMSSTSCPDEGADLNQDGLVDFYETLKVSGMIYIPLDSDLSTQIDGMSYGPIANNQGNYLYKRSTSFANLLSDLTAPDPDPTDSIIKLPPGENLKLDGRVVLIHGIGNDPSDATYPIACGKLIRIRNE